MKLILLYIFLLASVCLHAQTPKPSFTLNETEPDTTRNYQAANWIRLNPGFKYTAISTATFKGWINPNLTIPITTISNPKPGDTSGSANDGPYIPGSTYSTDPLTGITGLIMNGMTTTGTTDTTEVNSAANMATYTFPILWFKTVPLNDNINGAYVWKDITGNNTKLLNDSLNGTENGVEYQVKRDTMRTYNFNPSLSLPCGNISKALINKSNLSQTTVIGVWGIKEDFDKNNFVFAIDGRNKEGIVFSKQCIYEGDSTKNSFTYGNDTLRSLVYNPTNKQEVDLSHFSESSLRVATYYRANKPNNSLWGETPKAVITLGGKLGATNENSTSSYTDNVYQLGALKGFSPELLVFDRQLSSLECNKFETYLAIKYGITLDKSYISPLGNIIWDYSANQNYNNRITGYGREDAMGLYQKISTTSYEEAPYYSYLTTYDSFDGNDSYNSPSRYCLLVMGYQQENTPDNGNYVLFGDNNDSLQFVSSQVEGVTNQLKRQWVLNTNQSLFPPTKKTLQWNTSSTLNMPLSGFTADITKSGSLSTLWAVTQDTLKSKDGYFAWTVDKKYGPVTVKFGSNQANLTQGSYDYGYKIDSIGRVYPISKGSISPFVLFNVEEGQRIEMEKNGRVISLRVNGVQYKTTEITIDSIDYSKTFYGAVALGSNPSDITLSNFRHGGFIDTGHRIELSYLRIPELAPSRNNQPYLIIDRSGTGNFNASSEAYACDESDTIRSKIIFNNIFWDTDGNGKDMFTFGYKSLHVSQFNYSKSSAVPETLNDSLRFAELKIYYPDIHDMTRVTVKLQTETPVPTTILLMDMLGRIISRQELPESKDIQYTDINMPAPGVYVVTVLNKETRYSKKIICGK